MLYACVARFDVTGNLQKFFGFLGELNNALLENFFQSYQKIKIGLRYS